MMKMSDKIHEAALLLASTHAHWIYQNDVIWSLFMGTGLSYAFTTNLGYQRR